MASNFTSGMLYESAYSIPFNWRNHLPECVYKYHELVRKETNAPIELHMGVVLPSYLPAWAHALRAIS